jgi:hypothetical protein
MIHLPYSDTMISPAAGIFEVATKFRLTADQSAPSPQSENAGSALPNPVALRGNGVPIGVYVVSSDGTGNVFALKLVRQASSD